MTKTEIPRYGEAKSGGAVAGAAPEWRRDGERRPAVRKKEAKLLRRFWG